MRRSGLGRAIETHLSDTRRFSLEDAGVRRRIRLQLQRVLFPNVLVLRRPCYCVLCS